MFEFHAKVRAEQVVDRSPKCRCVSFGLQIPCLAAWQHADKPFLFRLLILLKCTKDTIMLLLVCVSEICTPIAEML